LLTLIAAAFGLVVGGVLSLLLDVEVLIAKFRSSRARR
jgi:hypothetical protein